MSTIHQSPLVPAQPAPADRQWPDPYDATSSTSDFSQSTVNTTDTSPPNSQPGLQEKEAQNLPLSSSSAAAESQAPYRPRTPPPQMQTDWRSSVPDPGMTSPTSALNSPERGAKRTASGAFKFPSPSILSPTRSSKHARHASTDSAHSRVSELSAQLRARLSYAMIKVQNGWEHKPINEVEHLASQSPYLSPTGRVSQRRDHYGRVRGTSDAALTRATRALHQSANGVQALPNPFQSVPQLVTNMHPYSAQSESLSAHARPTSAREQVTSGSGSQSSSTFRPAQFSSIRATTPTPQEQDALDSLISMSSPAHSVRYSRRHPNGTSNAASTAASSRQGSPTRSAFPQNSQLGVMAPPPLRPGSSRGSGGSSGHAVPVFANQDVTKGPVRSDGDVERLLDQMRAYSSDDERDL